MPNSEKPLDIDIPVKLADLKVAFSIPALAFEGDLPACIFHLQLITLTRMPKPKSLRSFIQMPAT
jgi:hypothetical protein